MNLRSMCAVDGPWLTVTNPQHGNTQGHALVCQGSPLYLTAFSCEFSM